MREVLQRLIDESGLVSEIGRASDSSTLRRLTDEIRPALESHPAQKLIRWASTLEREGVRAVPSNGGVEASEESQMLFGLAAVCWDVALADAASSSATRAAFGMEYPDGLLPADVGPAFHLAVCSLAAQKTADARISLGRQCLAEDVEDERWDVRVARAVGRGVGLLVRKGGGWEDIRAALDAIDTLRAAQADYEAEWVDSHEEGFSKTRAAVRLVGLYHLAQLVTEAGKYLVAGEPAQRQVEVRLARHRDEALRVFESLGEPLAAHTVALSWLAARLLVRNSIWSHTVGLGAKARELVQSLTHVGRENPVLELWPSQQAAFRQNLLDPYGRAVVVEMPTSAGKTLLAKFSIVQALSLNPESTVAYLAPTRALVNQLTLDLRADLAQLGFSVEQAVPSFELGADENSMLQERPKVLVSTPEKLDLLLKAAHPAVSDLALVVADEAHSIGEHSVRGPRLELLLGTLKREQPNVRFLLLSPFLPNGIELATWLSDGAVVPPIRVDWRPGRRVVGAVQVKGRGARRGLFLTTLPAAANVDVSPGIDVQLGPTLDRPTLASTSVAATLRLAERGAVLVLCRGRGTAETRAQELTARREEIDLGEFGDAVCAYLTAEVGHDNAPIVRCLRKGVAFHHSGLSHEARWLIERLVAEGQIDVITGTTTLAQGMNLPIRTVVVEGLRKGNVPLTYRDFWNIAGRAGRALVDDVGVVAFPVRGRAQREARSEFLQGEAAAIGSYLATLVDEVETIGETFNLAAIRRWPQLAELLRFLAHAIRVGGDQQLAQELEDLLRASLVFHQLEASDAVAARALVTLCRRYLEDVQDRGLARGGALALADSTGFSTPSILALLARRREHPEFQEVESWQPSQLFGTDITGLTDRLEVVGDLPEMSLSDRRGGPFNPERVARILRDWVNGVSLGELAEAYGSEDSAGPAERLSEFSRYLFGPLLSQATWGLGALESVSLAGRDAAELEAVSAVPSMIFFGVSSRRAVWLRMAGVPRLVAEPLSAHWGSEEPPRSFSEVRRFVDDLPEAAWNSARPASGFLTGAQLRRLWRAFRGTPVGEPRPQPA